MNRSLAAAIAAFTFNPAVSSSRPLAAFSLRDWKRTYHWLDTSGMALHFYSRLEDCGAVAALPHAVVQRLRQNLRDNELRCRAAFAEFVPVNRAFRDLGRTYAVHKGISLVPDFCPDLRLRVQFDHDFRVRAEDASAFQAALERLGYRIFHHRDGEMLLDTRPGSVARLADTYRPAQNHRVELHFDQIIGGEFMRLALPAGYLDRLQQRAAGEESFPALGELDRFLDQVGHFLRHFELGWIRLSWALELVTFWRAKFHDLAFWRELARFACAEPSSGISVAFALALLESAFQVSLPPELAWCRDLLPRRLGEWIEHYGHEALLAEFPGSKLPMLVFGEFSGGRQPGGVERKRLLPLKVPLRIAAPVDSSWAARIAAWRAQLKFVRVRARFHLQEGLRYWLARRHWKALSDNRVLPPA